MNEQQGSRGEANFVWKCQNCKVGLQIISPTLIILKQYN